MSANIRRGKAIRGDLALWDGHSSSVTRIDASGGTVTGLPVGHEVDVLQVYGSGSSRTRASLLAAITGIGSSDATLVLSHGTWTIDANLTVPANLSVRIPAGCVLSISSGVTLTFAGKVFVDDPTSWTSGSGTVVVSADGVHGGTYHQSAAERTAGITPTNYSHPVGHLKRYGAACDGTTDDTTAFQNALDANEGGYVLIPGGATTKITAKLTVPVDTHLMVVGEGTAVIDASAATLTSPGLIVCQGSISASLGSGLASAASAGALTVTLSSGSHGLTASDLIIVHDPASGSWNPDRSDYKAGEFVTVKSASGATVTLANGLIGAYPDTGEVYLVTPTKTRIEGPLEIIGNTADTSNLPTIYFKYGRNNVVEGVKFTRTTSTCLEFSNCYQPSVRNVDTSKLLTDAGSIQATGVTFSGCQYASCRDSILVASRHGASTGGGGLVVDRFNVFEHNLIASRQAAAADFHGCAEFCAYIDNHIDGSINLSGARNVLRGNKVYSSGIAALINMEAVLTVDHTIESNKFYLRGASTAYVIDANDTTDINSNTDEAGTLKVRGNQIHDETTADQAYFFIRNNGSTADNRLEFTDNVFTKTSSSKYGSVLAVSVVTGDAFAAIVFQGNTLHFANFGDCAADELVFRDNTSIRSATDTQNVTINGSASHILFENNYCKGGGRISLGVIGGGSNNLVVCVKGNTIIGTTNTTPFAIGNAAVVTCSSNTIGEPADGTQTNPISFQTVTTLRVTDDTYRGTGAPSLSSVGTVMEQPFWTTFTPTVTLVGGVGNTVPVYSTNVGRTMRVGNTRYVSIELSGDGGAEGAGTGALTIALPQATAAAIGSLNIPIGRLVNNALRGIVFGQFAAAASTVTLTYFDAIGTNATVTGAQQDNATRQLSLHFWYEVAP
jgi:hypothetical protein